MTVQGKKHNLIYCECGKTLLIIEIGKKLQIEDVTKEDK